MKELVVRIVGNTKDLTTSLNSALSKFSNFGKDVLKVGTVVTGALTGIGYKVVGAFKEAEEAQKKTLALLKATGSQAGVTANEIFNLASEIQKSTKYGDEALIGLQNTLLKFGNIKKDIFEPTTRSVVDLAAALDIDLNSAAQMVGRAINDPVQGLTALRRAGVQFTEEQKNMIAGFIKSNDLASAQKIILQQLDSKFKGTAELMAGGTGVFTQIWEDFGDVLEMVGEVVFTAIQPAAIVIRDFIRQIKDSGLVASVVWQIFDAGALIIGIVGKTFGLFGDSIRAVNNFFKTYIPLYEKVVNLFSDSVGEIDLNISLIDSLKVSLSGLYGWFEVKGYEILSFWEKLKAGIYEARAAMTIFDDEAKKSLENASVQAINNSMDYDRKAKNAESNRQSNMALVADDLVAQRQERQNKKTTTFGTDKGEFDQLFGTPTDRQIITKGKDGKGGEDNSQGLANGTDMSRDAIAKIARGETTLLTEDEQGEYLKYLQAQQDSKLDAKQKADLAMLENEKQFQDRMNKSILGGLLLRYKNEKTTNEQVEADKDLFYNNLLTIANHYGKESFKALQALNIAQAIMDTYTGATRVLAQYGFPLGPIFAGVITAAGLANVAQIRSQKPQKAAARGGLVGGGVDIGRDSVNMALRPDEMVVPSEFVKPLMPSFRDFVMNEDRLGKVGGGGGFAGGMVEIGFRGDADKILDARFRESRDAGTITNRI